MMKWKVVKNPRSSSADRSLECLKNDVQVQPQQNTTNNTNNNNSGNNDTNNNVNSEENGKQDTSLPVKDTNRQRDSSLIRKPSVVATDCINLKGLLGLSRQRSETNLSSLGLISTEPRRSRSEVRGVSCDRLTVGYHTTPTKPAENGRTRCSSPPLKSGCWIRGRKRERESRNPVKNNHDVHGKTIVTGSHRKRTTSKTRNGSIDCRTIVDGCDNKQKNKVPVGKSSVEPRRNKSSKRSGEEDIIEEEVTYSEIDHEDVRGKLLDENRDNIRDANKVIRKKGLAPKPQITTALFKDTNGDINLIPGGRKPGESPCSLNDISQLETHCKLSRKNQTYNGRNQDKKAENWAIHSVKLNNLKNNEKALLRPKNNLISELVIAVAEIHEETPLKTEDNNKNDLEEESTIYADIDSSSKLLPNNNDYHDVNREEEDKDPPYHIDTPDYSTLESVNCYTASTEDVTYSKDDIINCNTDCDESILDSSPLITSDNAKGAREASLSSILRDSSNENKDSEHKKTVRFEKLDLIEKYKKNKTESQMDTEDETDISIFDAKPTSKSLLDVNSNEIVTTDTQSVPEDVPQCSEKHVSESTSQSDCPRSMTVNVLVRNSSPVPPMAQSDTQNEESSTQFVVKKSFVITVAKQEMGFKSLCANKKPEVISENSKNDPQISVTFLCSGPPSEGWVLPSQDDRLRLRSISVPPRSLQSTEVMTATPAIRGRSKERRSKERHHCRKSHKAKKKDAVFVMPQAVIDELSQVLEKRKPSLDEIPVHP